MKPESICIIIGVAALIGAGITEATQYGKPNPKGRGIAMSLASFALVMIATSIALSIFKKIRKSSHHGATPTPHNRSPSPGR